MAHHEPTILISLTISPNPITLDDENCTLTITSTLQYPHPITIYTWPSIFALELAQTRADFTCIDLTDNSRPMDLYIEFCKRTPTFSLQVGDYDDQFLVTFHPGIPVTFTGKFALATRNFQDTLRRGHRYRFGIDPERGRPDSWLHGTREDVMTREHKISREHERSQVGIELCGGEVDFEVVGDTELNGDL